MKFFLLFLFWSLWYLNFSTRTIISPLLPVIEDELAISHAAAGGFSLYLSIGYTISLLLAGMLSSRIGYKQSIALSSAILVTSLAFLKFATAYAFMAIAFLFIGLGSGFYIPSAVPLITTAFDRVHWGKSLSFHETAPSFSLLSIPLLTIVALRFVEWKNLFVVLSVACLAVGLLFWVFSPDHHYLREPSISFSRLFRRRDFWAMAALWAFVSASGLGIYNVIPLFLVKENQIQFELANTMLGLSRIGGLCVTVLAGLFVDRYGVSKILLLVLLATGLSTIGLAVARSALFLFVILILQASIYPAFYPVALVAVSKLTSSNERSIFTGASAAIGVIFGIGLAPVILGAVADAWNFRIGFFSLGLLTTAASAFMRHIRGI